MHFPDDRDLGYFNQLQAERLVYNVVAGLRFSVWEPILLPPGDIFTKPLHHQLHGDVFADKVRWIHCDTPIGAKPSSGISLQFLHLRTGGGSTCLAVTS